MATEDQLIRALRAADEAGNEEDAARIAELIKAKRAVGPKNGSNSAHAPEQQKALALARAGRRRAEAEGLGADGKSRTRKYAEWLVANQDKKDSEQFKTVAAAYKVARQEEMSEPAETKQPGLFGDKRAPYGIEGLIRGGERPRERIVQPPENLPEALAGAAEATARGVGRSFFGVGDRLNAAAATAVDAAGNVIDRATGDETPRRVDFGERFAQEQQRTDELAELYPAANVAGQVTGAFAAIPSAVRATGAAAARALPKGDSFAKALRFAKGQPLRNTARTAAGGAVAGGVTEANLGGDAEDVRNAAATSAVLAPTVGAIVRGGGGAVNTARSLLDKANDSGFDALAKGFASKGVKLDPAELRRRAKEFFDRTGRGATLAEIVGPAGSREIRSVTRTFDNLDARTTLENAAIRQADELQDRIADSVTAGRGKTSSGAVLKRRDRILDAFMRQNGRRSVQLEDRDAEELLKEAGRLLPPKARERLTVELSKGTGLSEISLRDADNIRQALNRAARPGGENARFSNYADLIRDAAEDSVPEYGEALGEYRLRSRVAEGVDIGGRLRTASDTEFRQTYESADRGTRAGIRKGVRTTLANNAREGRAAAQNVARELAESRGLGNRLRIADPANAERARRQAQAELDALESVTETIRGTRIGSALENELKKAEGTLEAASATVAGSAGFKIAIIERTLRRINIPPTAASKLARAATDPSKTEEVIATLERIGVEPNAAQLVARWASRGVARVSGPAVAEGA